MQQSTPDVGLVHLNVLVEVQHLDGHRVRQRLNIMQGVVSQHFSITNPIPEALDLSHHKHLRLHALHFADAVVFPHFRKPHG